MDQSKIELLLEQQLKLIELFAKSKETPAQSVTKSTPSIDSISSSISEFHYDPESNVTFDTWYRRFEDVFNIDFANQDDSWKVRQLLRKLGEAELDKYCNSILPVKPRDRTFDDTIRSLSQLFGDQSSLFSIRYRCLKLTMNENDDFLTHVGLVNRECERFKLKSLTDDQFKSLILICSLQSPRLADIRTRLLNRLEQEPQITLNDMAEEYQRLMNLKHDTTMVQSGAHGGIEVHAVQHPPNSKWKQPGNSQQDVIRPGPNVHKGMKKPATSCWHCGAWHFVRFCPFKQHRCRQCNVVGHKEGFCKSSQHRAYSGPRSRSKARSTSQTRSVSNTRSLMTVFQVNAPGRRKFITILINGHPVRLQLDTASDITIISKKLWCTLGQPPVQQAEQVAISACGGRVQLMGQLNCCVSFRGSNFNGTCFVANMDLDLLGLDWFERLGLSDIPISSFCNHVSQHSITHTQSDSIIQQFGSLFQSGLGHCSAAPAILKLHPSATPVFRPKRPVPYASLPDVDAELQRLEREGVLVPVSYSAWAAPIVVIKKPNGTLRICADFSTGLNAALKMHHYPLPTPDDLFTILNGGKFFAKLDLAEAYLQVEVAPESRELLTINTHRGLFQYTRLPFGIKTAPAIFQQLMDTILAGIPCVAVYLDDVLIVGATPEELRNRTESVLQRIQNAGFCLRPQKCDFLLKSVKFLGFIFDADGRHPYPENIQAIQLMPARKD